VPEEFEDDYADVCAELVFEDFFTPHGVQQIGFSVVSDNASNNANQADREGEAEWCDCDGTLHRFGIGCSKS